MFVTRHKSCLTNVNYNCKSEYLESLITKQNSFSINNITCTSSHFSIDKNSNYLIFIWIHWKNYECDLSRKPLYTSITLKFRRCKNHNKNHPVHKNNWFIMVNSGNEKKSARFCHLTGPISHWLDVINKN